MKYFVSYVLNNRFMDTVVEINCVKGSESLVEALRHKVHPNRLGDTSDGMKPQLSRDCILLNFIKLD